MTVTEIMARARCERHYMDRFNCCADDPHVIVNMVNWTDFLPECQRDVKALKAAGYAIVPIEPTEAMIDAARSKLPVRFGIAVHYPNPRYIRNALVVAIQAGEQT